jgi:hypothetical protein
MEPMPMVFASPIEEYSDDVVMTLGHAIGSERRLSRGPSLQRRARSIAPRLEHAADGARAEAPQQDSFSEKQRVPLPEVRIVEPADVRRHNVALQRGRLQPDAQS